MLVVTPPTKGGKNNGYRQTNARTVYIIKYIIFLTDPSKKGKKRIRFKTRFYGHKKTRPNALNKRPDGWLQNLKKNRVKKRIKNGGGIVFCAFWHQKRAL